MATADNFKTSVVDDDCNIIGAPDSVTMADPYRYVGVSRSDGDMSEEEQHDAGEVTGANGGDTVDSAPVALRRQLVPQHHAGVGLSAVVDSVGRRF